MNVVGHRQRARVRIELNRRYRLARDQRAADHQRCRDGEDQCFFHVASYRAADDVAGCILDGSRRTFCARQAEISDTKSWSGLRQSISWTVLNSPSPLPALPNLPMILPSSSIL